MASLEVAQNWQECLICHRVTGYRNRLNIIKGINMIWGTHQIESSSAEKDLGVLADTKLNVR